MISIPMKRLSLSLFLLFAASGLFGQHRHLNVEALSPRIDSIALYGIESGCYPGCQIVLVQDGKIVFSKSYGRQRAGGRKVRNTDLYDLASITKSAAVALSVMKLYDEGRLRIEDRASKYLPWLQGTDKEDITIEELLFHTSGITGWIDFYSGIPSRKGAVRKRRDATHNLHVFHRMWLADSYLDTLQSAIARSPLGPKRYAYSDVGFDLLVWVVEAITGESLNSYLKRTFYEPMGIRRTMFLPAEAIPRRDIVPTMRHDGLRRGKEVRGYCEDNMVAFMGGVGGGAGLFSTGEDLARLFQMLLNLGELDGRRYLGEETCRFFLTHTSPLSPRLMGFGKPTADDPNNRRPFSAFGHGGVTGTDVWADPENKLIYVYLTNRFSPTRDNDRYMDNGIQRMFQAALYDCLE